MANAATFYLDGIRRIEQEIGARCESDAGFREALSRLAEGLEEGTLSWGRKSDAESFWNVFFPEALSINSDREAAVARLRDRRTVTV